jgi:hypothetical protein
MVDLVAFYLSGVAKHAVGVELWPCRYRHFSEIGSADHELRVNLHKSQILA